MMQREKDINPIEGKKNKKMGMALSRKILIVDDMLVNRRVLSKILSDKYDILEAANGQEAWEVLQKQGDKISLILLDIVMPIMDGYTFLALLQKDRTFSSIPVIIATQQDSEDDEVKALSSGATDFITKPYKAKIIRHRAASIIKLRETSAIMNLMQYDGLTGVYGKEFFYQQAELILNQNTEKEYDLICSDIENFKLVNDMFGIKTGDELLCHVADQFVDLFGKEGICGRIGGDIFAVLTERRNDYTEGLFEECIKKIDEFPIQYKLGIKFGIYQIHDLGISVSGMCDRAMLAIQTVKRKYAKFYAFYDDELRKHLLTEQFILENMEQAITERQFQVYLQPKYNIKNKKIVGAEALVRWIHPKFGFMSPGDFIPLFEKNGFITTLDRYVWEETCRIIRDWIDRGIHIVPVSVNVSRADIYNENLSKIIMQLIEKYDLKPFMLHLEITESAYTENQKQIIETISHLRKMKFVIEMDDFGTGYSSLSMLSELPIDVLKLDMQFIQSEMKKKSNHNVFGFIISLAKWMELNVIAEGVETVEQISWLENMECTYVQGYYFSKPIPNKEFTDKLEKSEVDDFEQGENNVMSLDVTLASNEKDKKTMLLVDDIEVHRTILKGIFEKRFNIAEANNGLAAYNYVLEHALEIEIIMLDLIMPVMDGFQFLHKIKENPLLSDIPIIVTSQTGEKNEVRVLKLGASDFISKPYIPEILLHRVQCAIALTSFQKQQRQLEEKKALLEEAYHDPLTGLLNRRGFDKAVAELEAVEPGHVHAVYMMDIDNLKQYNDTYGHALGDEILVTFSNIIQKAIRTEDVFARRGGDEFVIIMKNMPSKSLALKKGEYLCSLVREHKTSVGEFIFCSAGAAVLTKEDWLEDVIKRADQALYQAKNTKKGSCCLWGEELA